MTRLRAALAAVLLAAAPAGTEAAIVTETFASDAAFLAYLAARGGTEIAVAEGRYGNSATNGTREGGLHIGPNFTAGAPLNAPGAQLSWAQPQAFSLSRTGNSLTFTLGGYSATYTDLLVGTIDALALRIRTTNRSSLTLSGLDEIAGGPTFARANSEGAQLWLIESLGGDFMLTGTAALAWTAVPGSSNLAFQLKALDLADLAVPEPASLALLGAGLIGLALARRRRA